MHAHTHAQTPTHTPHTFIYMVNLEKTPNSDFPMNEIFSHCVSNESSTHFFRNTQESTIYPLACGLYRGIRPFETQAQASNKY